MPTIHDLPLEIIGRIIHIAYPGEPPAGGDEWRARRRFLRATSLVCRDWTPFAQAELWKFIRLNGWYAIDRFAFAAPGHYPVFSLGVWQENPVDDPDLDEILLDVRQVRNLEICGARFDSRCLCRPGFRDLKSLTLSWVVDRRSRPLSLPFQLDKLDLALDSRSCSNLVHALSQQSSITSLIIHDELTPLLPLAPQLFALQAKGMTRKNLDNFLSKCTRLRDLTVEPKGVSSVDHLVTPLQSLEIQHYGESGAAPLLDLLKSKAIAVKKLERLTVQLCTDSNEGISDVEAREEVEEWEEWEDVVKVCREKKIKLIVTAQDELS